MCLCLVLKERCTVSAFQFQREFPDTPIAMLSFQIENTGDTWLASPCHVQAGLFACHVEYSRILICALICSIRLIDCLIKSSQFDKITQDLNDRSIWHFEMRKNMYDIITFNEVKTFVHGK